MSSLDPKDAIADYSTLNETQMKTLDQWDSFFAKVCLLFWSCPITTGCRQVARKRSSKLTISDTTLSARSCPNVKERSYAVNIEFISASDGHGAGATDNLTATDQHARSGTDLRTADGRACGQRACEPSSGERGKRRIERIEIAQCRDAVQHAAVHSPLTPR